MKKKIVSSFTILIIFLILIGVFLFWKDYYKTANEWENLPSKKDILSNSLVEDSDIKQSIFKDYYEKARKVVSKMNLEEKVGQLFLVRYNILDIENYNDYYPGGYILFAKDFENHTKESMKEELEKVNSMSKYPLILGVDEEGGYVTRVSRFSAFRSEKFQSPKYYYELGGYKLLEEMENEKANLLKEIKINLNLAPVSDISTDSNDFIYNRSFGRNAKETSEFIRNMVTYANNNQINSCLKHFPGYGNNVDTHTGVAMDNRSYEYLLENDFLPFQSGIEAKVPCILVSHNIVTSIDERYPSSLSEKVIKELRDTLNYTGIILTDDLAMDAVKDYVENKEAATLAINAGNDMIITSDFQAMYNEVLNSIKENKIEEETINKAVLRITAWKYYSNLFEEE